MSATATGRHAALTSTPDTSLSAPMPPPSSAQPEAREAWVITQLEAQRLATREAIRVSAEALDVANTTREDVREMKEAIGRSPDKARGVEGSGFLGSLSAQIEAREDEKKRAGVFKLIGATVLSTLGVIGTVLGILKALGWIGAPH